MKDQYSFLRWLLVLSGVSVLFSNCSDKCVVTNTYVYYEPVYTTSAEIKAAIKFNAAQPISDAGKIYFKDDILFINEIGDGIHIIDNHNPSNPLPLGFLNIPGNYDLSIVNNVLYADSFIDLVVFDISDLQNIKEINRIEGLFNHRNSLGYYPDPIKGFVTDWKEVGHVTIEENDCATQVTTWGGIYYSRGVAFSEDAANSFIKTAMSPGGNTAGVGGSLARFTIAKNFLYALDEFNMDIVDVSTPSDPKSKKEIPLGWAPETLFPHKESLFIGTRTGMQIYDLAIPENPVLSSTFAHVSSCDPVVVEGDYAYVTLFSGNTCNRGVNELQVINIKDLKAPTIVTTYTMTNPHGLGIDNGTLFICDGTDGLKVYNASNVNKIKENLLAHYKDMNALDIIPFENIAMVIGVDGLYQYDYSDLQNIKLLSKIVTSKK